MSQAISYYKRFISSGGDDQTAQESIVIDRPLGTPIEIEPQDAMSRRRLDRLLGEAVACAPAADEWRAIAELKTTESQLGRVGYARVSMLLGVGPHRTKLSVSAPSIDEIEFGAIEDLIDLAPNNFASTAPRQTIPTQHCNVLLGNQAAGMLLHEVFGHGLELDNVLRGWGLPLNLRFPDGLMISEVSGSTGTMAGPVDDDGIPSLPGVLVERGRVVALIGRAGEKHRLPVLPRSRSEDWRHSPIGRVSDLEMATSRDFWSRAELVRGADLEVAEVDNARLRHGTQVVEMDFSYAERLVHGRNPVPTYGGRITIDLQALGFTTFVCGRNESKRLALCDKAGQRIPVSVSAPEVLLRSVSVGAVRHP